MVHRPRNFWLRLVKSRSSFHSCFSMFRAKAHPKASSERR